MLTAPNSLPYTAATPWFESSVYTSDFYDPEKTGFTTGSYPDDDTHNFDQVGLVISYFGGHGQTTLGNTDHQTYELRCNHDSDCTSLPAGMPAGPTAPGFCATYPGGVPAGFARPASAGTCAYPHMNRGIVISSTVGNHGNLISYGGGNVKWGESKFSTWASAGTNGGTNAAFLAISGAEYIERGVEVWPAFAGMHLFGNVLNNLGDTAIYNGRGKCFAEAYTTSSSYKVSQAWYDAIACMPTAAAGGGGYCYGYYGVAPDYGGGRGYNGCGGHVITGTGATLAESQSRLNETFSTIRPDSSAGVYGDTKGSSYFSAYAAANYDTVHWPFRSP